MGLVVTVAPTTEPLTVAEVRRHLHLEASSGEVAPLALTQALASPAAAGNVDDGDHTYRVTFVTADGETEGGTISTTATIGDKTVNGQVELTAIPLGGSAVTSRKIYRTKVAASDYFLLTTLADNTTIIYTDNTADSGLGAAAPTTNTTEDPYLVNLIKVAREWAEGTTHRALITQTLEWSSRGWPRGLIELPSGTLIVVNSINYIDTDGVSQLWAASKYIVDTTGETGTIELAYGESYPSIRSQANAVIVNFDAGYGAAGAVPMPIKQAMLLVIGAWYSNREEVVTGTIISKLPAPVAALHLIAPEIVTRF